MSTVYVDSGMAWSTVAGGFIANFLLGGLAKSYGLVMDSFREVFQSGTVYLMLAGGMIYTLMYCLSLANHYISERYGSRPVVVVGALGCCLSLLAAAYAPNLAVWVIAIGVGVGSSLACIYFTVFSVIGRCFRRYLGLANGISVAGVSVGQMAFPPLLTYLNEVYGARGGCVVMSSVCLHLLITAALMPRYIIDPDNHTSAEVKETPKTDRKSKLTKSHSSTKESTLITLDGMDGQGDQAGDDLDKLYTELPSEPDKESPRVQPTVEVKRSMTSLGKKSYVSLTSLNRRYDAKLCRALLIVYILAKIFGDVGDISVAFIAPTHGTQLGLDPITVSHAIAVSGAVDLVARIGIGLLTDRPCCQGRRGLLLASAWILLGANALLFASLKPMDALHEPPPTSLLVGFYVGFSIQGMCSGTSMTQMLVVLSDWVGPAKLSHSLALTMVILGLVITPGQFSMGVLADATGNFVLPLQICFGVLVLAGLVLLLEFPVRCYFNSKRMTKSRLRQQLNNGTHNLSGNHSQFLPFLSAENAEEGEEDDDIAMTVERCSPFLQPGISPVPILPEPISTITLSSATVDGANSVKLNGPNTALS